MALTPKQSRFVAEYPKDLNATQAAIRAGYSAKSAHVEGPKLLGNPRVKAEIDAALQRRADRVEVKADDILRELLRLATVDIAPAFDPETGALRPLHEIPEDVRRAIAGVETRQIDVGTKEDPQTATLTKVKFWDKTRGLELLGKHLKLFVDRVEHSADSSFADALKAARDRAKRR